MIACFKIKSLKYQSICYFLPIKTLLLSQQLERQQFCFATTVAAINFLWSLTYYLTVATVNRFLPVALLWYKNVCWLSNGYTNRSQIDNANHKLLTKIFWFDFSTTKSYENGGTSMPYLRNWLLKLLLYLQVFTIQH